MAEIEKLIPRPEIKKMSILDELRKLDDQRSKLLEGAKKEALDKANAAIKELNDLGFPYRLEEGESSKRSGGKGKTRKKSEICTICKFGTEPGHDGRHPLHRAQGQSKKALTTKQLEEAGLTKTAAAA